MGRRWLLESLIALALSSGCAMQGDDTGIILLFRSDLKPPGDIGLLKVTMDYGSVHREKDLPLGPGALDFPFRLGLVVTDAAENPMSILVEGFIAGSRQPIVTRAVNIDPLPGERRTVVVELNRSCIRAFCPRGSTCVPSKGCVSPRIELDGQLPDRVGPPCDCSHYFPMCVGARWRYKVQPAGMSAFVKNWFIADHARIGDRSDDPEESRLRQWDIDQGKAQVEAFLQVRDSRTEPTRRWVARQGSEVQWQRTEWVNGQWDRISLRYDRPRRLRLDESKTVPGRPWNADYTQVEYSANFKFLPAERKIVDNWEVVEPASVPGIPMEFRSRDLLCQRRTEVTGATEVVGTYCFARGLGKVYEITAGVEEEVLETANVPPCGVYPR